MDPATTETENQRPLSIGVTDRRTCQAPLRVDDGSSRMVAAVSRVEGSAGSGANALIHDWGETSPRASAKALFVDRSVEQKWLTHLPQNP